MIHGGAYMFGDKGGENVAKFLNAGYAVASINYRLTGEAQFPAPLEDCKAAVRWLRANASKYGYDPNRFGAYGESAGGTYVALLGTTGDIKTFDVGENLSYSSSVQAVVDFFGPIDFLQMDSMRKPGDITFPPSDAPEAHLIGGPVLENKEKSKKANPITYIDSKTSPFFIAHGDEDKSALLEDALEKANITTSFYIVRGAGHAFRDATADAKAIEFFRKYLAEKNDK